MNNDSTKIGIPLIEFFQNAKQRISCVCINVKGTINNGQAKDTGNIWHRTNTKNTTQKAKKMSNRIGGVIISILTASAVDHDFKSLSDQAKDSKIGIC